MKKILALILVMLLMLAVLAGCGSKQEVIADPVTVEIPDQPLNAEPEVVEVDVLYGKVISENTGINIRATPSVDGIVVGTADIGEVLRVLEQGEWCKVEFDDGVGYVFGELLELYEGEPEPEEAGPEDGGESPEGNDVITRVVE